MPLPWQVLRVRSRHQWRHSDLIQLARVTSSSSTTSLVLKAAVRGVPKALAAFQDKVEAQPILDYVACVDEMNKCDSTEQAVKLMDKHSFDIDSVPPNLLEGRCRVVILYTV